MKAKLNTFFVKENDVRGEVCSIARGSDEVKSMNGTLNGGAR